MRRGDGIRSLARIGLRGLLAVICTGLSPAAAQEASPPPDQVVLTGLFKHFPPIRVSNGAVRGFASYQSLAKTVSIEWFYKVTGLTDGSLPDPGESSSVQKIAVPFWPTEVIPCTVDQVAVAGRTTRGETTIHILELGDASTPTVSHDPSGERQIPELSVPIESTRTVFLEKSETVGDISLMAPILGAPGHILVQFIGVGGLDMYDLDLETGARERVVTPNAEGAGEALVVSELRAFSDMQAARHASLGDLYWFHDPGGTDSTVMLLDEDMDGDLDSFRILAVSDWTELYGDAGNYVAGMLRR